MLLGLTMGWVSVEVSCVLPDRILGRSDLIRGGQPLGIWQQLFEKRGQTNQAGRVARLKSFRHRPEGAGPAGSPSLAKLGTFVPLPDKFRASKEHFLVAEGF